MVKTISSVIELILYICHLVCYEDNMYYVGSVTFKTRTQDSACGVFITLLTQ